MHHTITLVATITGLLALVGLGIYLAATSHENTNGKTIIRWAVDAHPIRKVTIALFEKRNPKIEVMNDPDASQQRLLTQIAGGIAPDVMAMYTAEQLRMFAQNDLLLDLRPYVKKMHIPVDDLYPGLAPMVYYKDKIVAIPENCGTYNLFYNKKLFRQAGVPYPKPDWTWQDCLEAAKKLTKYKVVNGRKVPIQKGILVPDAWWPCFVWSWGGNVFSKDHKHCLLNTDEAKQGIRFLADLRLKYHVAPSSSEAQSMAPTGDYGGDMLLFKQEKVAMVMIGRFMITQYRLQKDLDWDVAYLPRGPVHVNIFGGKSYAIPKSSAHKEAAVKFVLHILSKENQLLIANYGDGLPTRRNKEIVKGFLYNPQYPKEKNNQIYVDELKYGRPAEDSPFINGTDFSSIADFEFGRMWLGEQTPEQACDKIAKRADEVIRRNLANPNFLK
ncbi:sugar ABC transporter substrate-binding protein [bacterium]|nr:sugar ABC transporter substrate-binding protein [bacterium]